MLSPIFLNALRLQTSQGPKVYGGATGERGLSKPVGRAPDADLISIHVLNVLLTQASHLGSTISNSFSGRR